MTIPHSIPSFPHRVIMDSTSSNKRSFGLLGIDYGSDSDSDDEESDHQPQTPSSLSGSPLATNNPNKKKLRFAGPDQLTTIIHFDPLKPIDSSQGVLSDDDFMVRTILEDTRPKQNSFSFLPPTVTPPSMTSSAFEKVPAPPPLKTFSFAKNSTVTVTKKPITEIIPPLETTKSGLWSSLSDSSSSSTEGTAQVTSNALSLADKSQGEHNTQEMNFEYFCDVCHYTIDAGEYRYDCRVCAKDAFTSCEDCYVSSGVDKKKLHNHGLFRVLTTT